MGITKKSGRQKALTAILPFTYADFNKVTTVKDVQKAIELPKGAVVLSGFLVIDTAFNSTTTDVMTVGDEASDSRYKAGIDAKTPGLTALVPTGFKTTATTNIVLTLTPTGAAMATQGAGRLVVQYVIEGRSEVEQG